MEEGIISVGSQVRLKLKWADTWAYIRNPSDLSSSQFVAVSEGIGDFLDLLVGFGDGLGSDQVWHIQSQDSHMQLIPI